MNTSDPRKPELTPHRLEQMVGDEPVLLTETPNDSASDRVATALRRIREATATGSCVDMPLEELADKLEAIADEAEELSVPQSQRIKAQWQRTNQRRHNAITGAENPLSPPLTVYGCRDGSIESTATLGIPYQGPPGLLHGGYSALFLDHLLGHANDWVDRTGMTAKLEINYRRPTPLFEPLRFRAWVDSHEGRKTFSKAEITHEGEACVEVTGLFIQPSGGVPKP